MTTSAERAELVRFLRDLIAGNDAVNSPHLTLMTTTARALANALEASEAEKARLIEAVRSELPRGGITVPMANRLQAACDEAEAGG